MCLHLTTIPTTNIYFQCGIVAIETPAEWRDKFKGYPEKQLKKRMCDVRVEKLRKTGEGCFLRQYVGKREKTVRFTTFRRNHKDKSKELEPDEAMDRNIFEKDCLEPVEYAYNNPGSLFPPAFTQCNLHKLDTPLQLQTHAYGDFSCSGFSRKGVPGITSSMLYIGTYGSTFPWHTEDADLPSVNYMHQGCAKVWFSIPASKW